MPVDVCLSLPLIDRVKELSNIFARGNLQELHNSVVLVVDNIFGYSGGEGWALHAVNEADEPHLFGSIREFLSPNGRFLEVLSSRLTLEFPSIYHDFPLWLLSTDSQNSAWSGDCKQPRTPLSLNAFTYYMFAFMCYASYPKWKQELALCDLENSLYRTLFDDYLGFYLYTDPTTVNVMASKINILRSGSQIPVYQNEFVGEYMNGSTDACFPDFRLFWQTEAVLQAVCEFLLSWRTTDNSIGITDLPKNPSAMIALSPPLNHAEFSTRPTVCQIFLVRCFLKYFYFTLFNNANSNCFQILQQQIIWNKFLNYRKYLYNNQGVIVSPESSIPHHNIMNRFSRFIVYCFQHWPFDLSFEVVLETWLSSIQPWRYAGSPQLHTNTRFSSISSDAPLNLKIDNSENYSEWLTFVVRHYSLYVGLFLLFLQRVTKIDLHVYRNAHMVYRVTKVFSQDGFKMLLLNTEKILSEQQHQHDGTLPTTIASEYQTEQSGLWNPVIISTVVRVLNCMMVTKGNLQSQLIQKMDKFSSDSQGWFDKFTKWLCSFLIFDMDNSDENVNKCIFYLTEGIHSLREFFAIQETFETVHDLSLKPPPNGCIQWDDLSASPIITRPHFKSLSTSPKSPSIKHPYVDNLSPSDSSYSFRNIPKISVNSQDLSRYNTKLTPLDRFQIIMGVKRPYVCQQLINSNKYAPTMNTSYENRYILTLCNYLEDKFNEKMKQHFIHWCSLSDIRGRFARQILLPSLSSYPKQHESQSSSMTNNPRISFRLLANYYVLLRLLFLYIFSYFLFGISSPLLYVMCLIALYLFYEFVITLIGLCHEKVKNS
ncbi:unnamed protein product [Schistosoma rodhaini]|nr:unnamed protein product [Schistosoma rodhaini]